MEPRFRWLQSNYLFGKFREIERPFQYMGYAGVKESKYHNLSELMLLPYSASIKKSLQSAKPGTKIKICYYSRGSDLYVQRLTDEEIDMLDDISKRKDIVDSLNDKIKQVMSLEYNQIRQESNKIAKLKRKYEKMIEEIK